MENKVIEESIHTQIRRFRTKAALSYDALALLSGIGKTTIFRMEKEHGDFLNANIEKIANILNLSPAKFVVYNFDTITEVEIDKLIDKYIVKNNIIDPHKFIEKSRKSMRGPKYYVQILIEAGYFLQKRRMAEITDHLQKEYGVIRLGPSLSNALKVRPEIKSTETGQSTHLYYQMKPSSKKKPGQ